MHIKKSFLICYFPVTKQPSLRGKLAYELAYNRSFHEQTYFLSNTASQEFSGLLDYLSFNAI